MTHNTQLKWRQEKDKKMPLQQEVLLEETLQKLEDQEKQK